MNDKLRESLEGWTDWDHAQHAVGLALGIFTPEQDFTTTLKGVFWSANPLGDTLFAVVQQLVKAGVLESREEDIQFRWNPNFRGIEQAQKEVAP